LVELAGGADSRDVHAAPPLAPPPRWRLEDAAELELDALLSSALHRQRASFRFDLLRDAAPLPDDVLDAAVAAAVTWRAPPSSPGRVESGVSSPLRLPPVLRGVGEPPAAVVSSPETQRLGSAVAAAAGSALARALEGVGPERIVYEDGSWLPAAPRFAGVGGRRAYHRRFGRGQQARE
jgi:hypothetical protein